MGDYPEWIGDGPKPPAFFDPPCSMCPVPRCSPMETTKKYYELWSILNFSRSYTDSGSSLPLSTNNIVDLLKIKDEYNEESFNKILKIESYMYSHIRQKENKKREAEFEKHKAKRPPKK